MRSTPADRHARRLQRAHQLDEEAVAAAHQDQDVAGPDRPALELQQLAVVAASRRSAPAMQPGQPRRRGRRCRAARSAAPSRRLVARRLGPEQRPQLDQPAMPAPALGTRCMRRLRRPRPSQRRVAARTRRRPAPARRRSSGTTSSSGMVCERLLGLAAAARRTWPRIAAELGRVGALEAVDRLLLVADHEDGARRHRRGADRRRRTPRSAPRRCATAPGWCPAPRRSACGRCRHPA